MHIGAYRAFFLSGSNQERRSDRLIAGLTGTNTDRIFHWEDENFSVADLAGLG